jgi:hypothetical protein
VPFNAAEFGRGIDHAAIGARALTASPQATNTKLVMSSPGNVNDVLAILGLK